jgi:hypothetical protein
MRMEALETFNTPAVAMAIADATQIVEVWLQSSPYLSPSIL